MKKLIEKDGKYYEECDVIALSTQDAVSPICYDIKYIEYQLGEYFDQMEYPIYQHLYVLSNEYIGEGDWFVNQETRTTHQMTATYNKPQYDALNNSKHCKKIVAATDQSLMLSGGIDAFDPLPNVSKEFFKQFCEAGGIWKVLVEYIEEREYPVDEVNHKGYFKGYNLKVSLDNTIAITLVEERQYSEREMRYNLLAILSAHDEIVVNDQIDMTKFKNWINENLHKN